MANGSLPHLRDGEEAAAQAHEHAGSGEGDRGLKTWRARGHTSLRWPSFWVVRCSPTGCLGLCWVRPRGAGVFAKAAVLRYTTKEERHLTQA